MAANNIYIQVDFNSQTAQQNVNALNQAIASTGTTSEKSSQQATKSLQSVNVSVSQTTRAFGELTTALAGLGIARMVSSIAQVGAELGRAQLMMAAFTGSAADAARVFEAVRNIAAESPFRFPELEQTAQRLAGFGVAARDIPRWLRIISDQAAAMGGSIENVNSIVTVFGRVLSKEGVAAMDLMRLLPAQGVRIGETLKKALGVESLQEATEVLKSGSVDYMKLTEDMLRVMEQHTGGAAARIDDLAKSLKNLRDELAGVADDLIGERGFGPALRKVGQEIRELLSPVADLYHWIMQLDEGTKQWIVRGAALIAVLGPLRMAFSLLSGILGPLFRIIGAGLPLLGAFAEGAAGLLASLATPAVLVPAAAVGAFVAGFTALFPKQAQEIEQWVMKWATDLWAKVKETFQAAKTVFYPPPPPPVPAPPKAPPEAFVGGGAAIESARMEANLKEVQTQVQKWADEASKTMLQAFGAPIDAIPAKYKELLDKLNEFLKKNAISEEHSRQLRGQLSAAEDIEVRAKVYEAEKKHIEEVAKLNEERVKGSAEAQIAYIEALGAQDLRGRVAAIDKVTALRLESAREVAKIETDALQEVFGKQQDNLAKLQSMGVDVTAASAELRQQLDDKRAVINQREEDEIQKYRLEGWKKANDAIIEDQKRVYEAFKGGFDEIFDALTSRTKSVGQALGDVFRKLALGEVRNLFSSQGAAFATEAAGYGRPESQITRGGILGTLLQRGMPPRPPGPPPEAYIPGRTDSGVTFPVAGIGQGSANRLAESADLYSDSTTRFALAVSQFAGATVSSRGTANRSMADAAVSDAGAAFEEASARTGVSTSLLRAVAQTESGMRSGAVSPKGAMGLMQLMPSTMRDWGVTQPFNVQQNVMGGAQQLQRLLSRYGGDVPSALAAYNMGPAAFDRAMARGGTLPRETQNYVQQVQALMTQGAIQQASTPFARATHDLPMPPGFSTQGGQLSYETPTAAALNLPGFGGTGALTTPSVAELASLPQGPSAMQRYAGVLGPLLAGVLKTGGGAGGGTQQAGLGGLLNLSRLRDLFGIGGAATGGTSLGSVLGSGGVANLAGMAGMALLAQGLQRRVTPLTVAGGALSGVALGRQLGMTPLGGALMGTGLGVFAAGVQRGGVGGLAMDVGGGALAGAAIGTQITPGLGTAIGAAIGAGVGAITGVVRMFVQTEQERIRSQIKQVYGIDIPNRQILTQVQQIVDQNYGGSVSVGVRSQQVQDLVRLYALSTGQVANLPRPMYAATIAQSTQGLQLQPVYAGGVQVQNPYTGPTSYQYQTAVASAMGLKAGTSLGVPGASGLITQQWQQLALQTIQGNPSAIAMASAAAASAGDSRLTTTQAMQEPLTALS